jgi:predicted secreted Zn-dependent protease
MVLSLNQDISDHTPLLLNTGESCSSNSQHAFKFELGWLLRDGFYDLVQEVWSNESGGHTPLEKWQSKIRRLRQYLRGWEKHTSGLYKKEKSHS